MRHLRLLVLIGSICLVCAVIVLPLMTAHAKPIQWTWCSGDPEGHVNAPAFKWFKKELEKRTNGRMILNLYFAGALYSEREGLEAIQTGIGQIGAIYAGYYPTRFAISQGFMVPGTIPNAYAGARMLEELYKEFMKDEVESQKCSLACATFPDEYSWQTKKPIRTPDDLKGLKMRSASGIHNDMLKMVGAIPVSMSTIDAYDALQKGVLDGVQLATSSATRYKFYELCPYLTIPNFIYFNTNWGVQTTAYRSLPKDLQKIVYQLFRELSIEYTASYVKNAQAGLSNWPNKHVLTPEENQTFLERFKPLRDQYIKAVGSKGEQMLKAAKPLYEKYYKLTYEEAMKLQQTTPVQGILD